MIKIEHIDKWFDDRQILFDINAEFKPGVANLVIGASGSGKSVLIKCMVGLLEPTSGKILYGNQDFISLEYQQKQNLRREIGMLFQNNALFDSLTVEENIDFPLRMFSKMSPEERKERVNFCLQRVQLTNANKKYPAEKFRGVNKKYNEI